LDQISISILCNVTSAFRPGTSQTKAAFDTRTAAINITPDTKGQYNLDEIKRDSLWLAKEAKIDEVTALRITILEWQTRIPTRILAGVGDQESTDVGAFASSIFSASPQLQSFDSKESRRARILKIYFSERVFLIKTSEILLQSSPAQQTASARHQEDKGEPRSHWIEQVATALFKTRTLDNGKNSERHQPFLQECIGALRDRLDSLEAGSGISIEDIEEVELLWAKSQIVEMIHIMQAMFVMIGSSPRITSSTALLAWLRFIDTYGSFDSFEPVRFCPC
jgi:nuclear pore complex protein Nup188